MKNINIPAVLILAFSLFVGCENDNAKSDAFGNFEADEILVAAKGQGELIDFKVREGHTYTKGAHVGTIDTTQLHLQKAQLRARMQSIKSQAANIEAQREVVKRELSVYEKNLRRIKALTEQKAATPQQLDEIEGKVNVATARLEAYRVQKQSVLQELNVLESQLASLDAQINDYRIINPINGIVLNHFKKPGETVMPGTGLFKIAPASSLILRVYVDGEMLHKVRKGDEVKVYTDVEGDKLYEDNGVVTWVANEAEFTPKVIQTRKERTKLVYAVKIKVKNKEGRYKIGMPAEVKF
ncbi:putative efflux pump membrane fusion protein [Salinivirga cyanobacteriivorans]|uniref:Putative efflux pump membrane fusion protein n=1 Tax=Salinivirga cyanobacteriivorans TaxID=1307839 RepID=A0A0S2I2G1_9BACT|nr:HlyD family efflux transporter periplasmic adaptor subunit [Salinivirga cyanobacteriivorans]ALO16379.1 putative efflux pump membrane fusion protein [Salinivirga cyanobacteriivorans]